MLLPVALRNQHVDYLNARRVQTLMHVHGSGRFHSDPDHEDPQLVDLDALAAEGKEAPKLMSRKRGATTDNCPPRGQNGWPRQRVIRTRVRNRLSSRSRWRLSWMLTLQSEACRHLDQLTVRGLTRDPKPVQF